MTSAKCFILVWQQPEFKQPFCPTLWRPIYRIADVESLLSLVQFEPGVAREGGVAALHVALVRLLPRVRSPVRGQHVLVAHLWLGN